MADVISSSSKVLSSSQKLVKKNDPSIVTLKADLSTCISQLKPSTDWNSVANEMERVLYKLETYQDPWQRYEVDLLREVVVPYIQKLKGRYFTDASRKKQISEMLYILSLTDLRHPAEALIMLDEVAYVIHHESRLKGHFFESELLIQLNSYLRKTWRPILIPTKDFLTSIGSMMLGLGLVGLIGWPLAVLYPLLSSTKQLSGIMRELEHKKSLSYSSLFQLAKLLAVSFAALQMVAVLQAYTSVSYTALIGAAACFVCAQSDELVKKLCVPLSPYVAMMQSEGGFSMDRLIDVLQRGVSREEVDKE
ncbi:hypothetical protein EON65_43870, partial [archaeon]